MKITVRRGSEWWAAFGRKIGSRATGVTVENPWSAGRILAYQYAKGLIYGGRDRFRLLKAEAVKKAKSEGKEADFYAGAKQGRQDAAAEKEKAAAAKAKAAQAANGRIDWDRYRVSLPEAPPQPKAEGNGKAAAKKAKAAAKKAKAAQRAQAAKVKTATAPKAMALTTPTGGMTGKWGPYAVLGGMAVLVGLAVWGMARRA